MKRLLLFITFFSTIRVQANLTADSLQHKKQYKNFIEVGYNAAWFFDMHRLAFFRQGGLSWLPNRPITTPLVPSYIKYARIFKHNIELGLSSYTYGVLYQYKKTKGDLMYRWFDDVTLSMGRSFTVSLNKFVALKYTISPSVSYRWGTEWVYLAENDYHDVIHICSCDYNSFGLGGTGSMDIVLRNRLYFGGSLGYTYYFEKSKLKPTSTYYYKDYKPNRDVLVFHPRLGVLF